MHTRPPGIHEEIFRADSSIVSGDLLRFTISVPECHVVAERCPLIVVLHYAVRGDVTPHFYGRGVLENLAVPALADLGAVIVAPDSIDGDWTTATSEATVLHIMDRVQAAYGTDPRRVVLTGYSKGGHGAWHLAARHPQRFSAAVPVSARPGEAEDYRVPLYVIHSVDDELIPIDATRQRVAHLQKHGVDVQLSAVQGITHFETARFVESLRGVLPWVRSIWG